VHICKIFVNFSEIDKFTERDKSITKIEQSQKNEGGGQVINYLDIIYQGEYICSDLKILISKAFKKINAKDFFWFKIL